MSAGEREPLSNAQRRDLVAAANGAAEAEAAARRQNLALLVMLRRALATRSLANRWHAAPGDLVLEAATATPEIGWLVSHGPAPYAADGTGPTREVWDVLPLKGSVPAMGSVEYAGVRVVRFENAEFFVVPEHLWLGAGIERPAKLDAMIKAAS